MLLLPQEFLSKYYSIQLIVNGGELATTEWKNFMKIEKTKKYKTSGKEYEIVNEIFEKIENAETATTDRSIPNNFWATDQSRAIA